MANAFSLSVLGINEQTYIGDVILSTFGVKAYEATNDNYPGAVVKVVVPRPATSGNFDNYWTDDTLSEILAAINQDAVVDLSVVGTLDASGAVDFASTLNVDGATTLGSTLHLVGAGTFDDALTVTGATILSSTLVVAGAVTFNGDVTLGAGDDLTGSTTSALLGFNTMAPIPTLPTAVAINSSATMSAGDWRKGLVTSTSAAGTAITTRTATELAAELGAGPGSLAYLVINNVDGASTVTLTPGSGVTAASAVTGGDDMTLATTEIGVFLLTFVSTTVAQLSRVQ